MNSQRTVKVNVFCQGKHETVLDLRKSRLTLLRDKALAGRYGDEIQKKFAKHENSHEESLLMAAIDYCEERARKNYSEIDAIDLEARMLRAEITSVDEKLRKNGEEIAVHRREIEMHGPELGASYYERKEELEQRIYAALSALSKVSKKAGLFADEGREIRDFIAESLKTDAKITEKDGTITVEIGPESALKISEMINEKVKNSEIEEIGPELFTGQGNTDSDRFKMSLLKMIDGCSERLIDNASLLLKMLPDRTATRIIIMQGGSAEWLDSPSPEAAAQADEQAVKNAAKEIRKHRSHCKYNEKFTHELNKLVREEIYIVKGMLDNAEKTKEEKKVKAGMEEDFNDYLKEIGGLVVKLEDLARPIDMLRRANSELAELLGVYQKAISIYPLACRKALELENRMASPEGYAEKKKRLEELDVRINLKKARIKSLDVMQRTLKGELDCIVKKRTEKEWTRRQHIEKSPKAKPIPRQVFSSVQPEVEVDLESARQQKIETALNTLVSRALEHFPDFSGKGKYSPMRKKFCKVIRELGKLYLENGCRLTLQAVIADPVLKNQSKHEPTNARSGSECQLLRILFGDKFRMILDLETPEKPSLLFAGRKFGNDGSDNFLREAKYNNESLNAARDGRSTLFNVLKNI